MMLILDPGYRAVVVVVVCDLALSRFLSWLAFISTQNTILYPMVAKHKANTYMSPLDAHQVSSLGTDLPRGRISLLYCPRYVASLSDMCDCDEHGEDL